LTVPSHFNRFIHRSVERVEAIGARHEVNHSDTGCIADMDKGKTDLDIYDVEAINKNDRSRMRMIRVLL
jgi:hypothetical protein